jgi:cytochrome b subunit of formate dehydrogenase
LLALLLFTKLGIWLLLLVAVALVLTGVAMYRARHNQSTTEPLSLLCLVVVGIAITLYVMLSGITELTREVP